MGLKGVVDPEVLQPDHRYIRTYEDLKDWRGQPMRYWVSTPEGFDSDQQYPILLEWPGKGGGPNTDVFREAYGVTDHIHVGLTYPQGNPDGSAMLYPTEAYTTFIRHVYDDVTANFNGHPEYVFIGGFSAGGFMATGPGIALMMRSDLKDQLTGVLAGGCNWMCDPRYAHKQNILLWYSEDDPNSSDLTRRLPEVRKYAADITVIKRQGAEHACKPKIEGPAIRRFLAQHGPDQSDEGSDEVSPGKSTASAAGEK
jgi:dienelactone hydrolase